MALNAERLGNFIGQLDETSLKDLSTHSKIYTVVHKSGQVLYVPAGYAAVEIAVSGVLLYGWRRSAFIGQDVNIKNFEAHIKLMDDGKPQTTKKLEVALSCLRND